MILDKILIRLLNFYEDTELPRKGTYTGHLILSQSHHLTSQFPLQLFKTILNYPWFKNSSLILFLNKKDLFAEKVPFSYIGDYFPEYDGAPTDVEYATRFISELYQCCYMESSTINDARTLFVHMTCATDTENIRIVFENVKSTVLQKNITELNLG